MTKLCECGCGQKVTAVEDRATKRHGVDAYPVQFISGHNRRGAGKHNLTRTPEYRAYQGARQRCTNPKSASYEYYGGRGIQFKFQSFEEFFAHVGKRPSPQHSMDRYPNKNGHYKKGNVRWATRQQQIHNRRPYRRQLQQFTDNEIRTEFFLRGLNK